MSLYLAEVRVPRPKLLPRLAAALDVAPSDLCTAEHERLVHLRVFTGRSRAQMANAPGVAEERSEISTEPGAVQGSGPLFPFLCGRRPAGLNFPSRTKATGRIGV
ncbi:hypothetical protein ACFYXM_24155 [Streptomyces sp. NPDC002476]|uniref:hypothetical protein n=1 Tax=Streptomyces sp. NPDC002476 TaxID=3364648 RepID=UPI00368F7BA2